MNDEDRPVTDPHADQTRRFAELIAELSAAVERHTGVVSPLLHRPPATPDQLDAASRALGRPLPDELTALWSVTAELVAFGFWIGPPDYLATADDSYRLLLDQLAEFMNEPLSPKAQRSGAFEPDPFRGPAPRGEVIAVSTFDGFDLLIEVDGPTPGRLVGFDARPDYGYFDVAPSLEELLRGWVAVADAGLIFIARPPEPFDPWVTISFDAHDQIRAVLATTRCAPAAVLLNPE